MKEIRRTVILIAAAAALTGCVSDPAAYTDNSETAAAQEFDGSIRQTEIRINLAKYLLRDYVWEMGGEAPVPSDFFDVSALENDIGIGRRDLESLAFETPVTDEMLRSKGDYLVYIVYGGKRLAGHLSVVDTTAPEIIAPDRTEYEMNDTIRYRQGVIVTDNSGEDLELMIDSGAVKANVPGSYTVYYSAVDSSGNRTEVCSEIIIREGHRATKEEVDHLADELLESLVSDTMTQREQLEAVFDWCYGNIRNTSDADKNSVVQGAYEGLSYRAGDCFTYYATAAYMMNRLGIENLSVSKKSDRATHYWSLVCLDSEWYHFDCSPHKGGYRCFLQTDGQVRAYAREYEKDKDYFSFDESGMPVRSEKRIYDGIS